MKNSCLFGDASFRGQMIDAGLDTITPMPALASWPAVTLRDHLAECGEWMDEALVLLQVPLHWDVS